MEKADRGRPAEEDPGFDPVPFPADINGYLWRPVLAGFWRQRELSEYTLHDLVEVNRVLDVHEENQRRARKAMEDRLRERP
jgi:hypothetical protein